MGKAQKRGRTDGTLAGYRRMRGRGDGNRQNWLLIKKDDEVADAADGDRLARTATTSVASKRTMERIAAAADRARAKKSIRTSADAIESVRFTHPDRVLYPETGLTKRDLAEYYLDIAGRILPEVALRPLSLVRCPEGIGKTCFYQKHVGASPPGDLHCVRIKERAGTTCYAMIKDAKGLVSLVADVGA
jgi:bifunctional non-homologous end joining protein LigD